MEIACSRITERPFARRQAHVFKFQLARSYRVTTSISRLNMQSVLSQRICITNVLGSFTDSGHDRQYSAQLKYITKR